MVHPLQSPAVAACSANSISAPDLPPPLSAASKRGEADASVTVLGMGVINVYDKYKRMQANCITHSKGGRRCRLTSSRNVGSDPDHGLVGFAMLWLLWSDEEHVSCKAEHCNPFFYALLAASVDQRQVAREQFFHCL